MKREPASSGAASSGGASGSWTETQLLRAIQTVTPLSPALVSPSQHLLEVPGCQHPSSPAAASPGSILPRAYSSPAPHLAGVLPWAALLMFRWRAMPPGSLPLGTGSTVSCRVWIVVVSFSVVSSFLFVCFSCLISSAIHWMFSNILFVLKVFVFFIVYCGLF